jgi:hypothetical protein
MIALASFQPGAIRRRRAKDFAGGALNEGRKLQKVTEEVVGIHVLLTAHFLPAIFCRLLRRGSQAKSACAPLHFSSDPAFRISRAITLAMTFNRCQTERSDYRTVDSAIALQTAIVEPSQGTIPSPPLKRRKRKPLPSDAVCRTPRPPIKAVSPIPVNEGVTMYSPMVSFKMVPFCFARLDVWALFGHSRGLYIT